MKIKYLKDKSMLFNFHFITFVEILTFKPLKKQISNAAATTITTSTTAAYLFAFLPMLMVRMLYLLQIWLSKHENKVLERKKYVL